MEQQYATVQPSRAEVDAIAGAHLLEFGTDWCGHCRAAQPVIQTALAAHPALRRTKVEDGSGRRLGRSFGVTLWPTLVFLKDGVEITRLVRPADPAQVRQAAALVDASPHAA